MKRMIDGLCFLLLIGIAPVLLAATQSPAPMTSKVSVAITISPAKSAQAVKLAEGLSGQFQEAGFQTAIVAADSQDEAKTQASNQKLNYLVFAQLSDDRGHVGSLIKKMRIPVTSKSGAETKSQTLGFVLIKIDEARQIASLDRDASENKQDMAKNVALEFVAKLQTVGAAPAVAETKNSPGPAININRPRLVVQTAHSTQVIDFVYSRDGDIAATLGADGVLKIWAANAGKELRTFAGYRLEGVGIAADGKKLATVDHNGTVRLIDTHLGVILRTISNPAAKNEATPNGGALMLAQKPTPIAFSGDGTLVVHGGRNGAWVIDAAAGAVRGPIGPQQTVDILALDPTGRYVATVAAPNSGGRGAVVHGSGTNQIQIYRTSDRKEVGEPFPAFVGTISALAFDADGGQLVVGSRNGSIRILDPRKGEQIGKQAVMLNRCDEPYETERKMEPAKRILNNPLLDIVPGMGNVKRVANVDYGKYAAMGCESIEAAKKMLAGGLSAFLQLAPAAGIRSLDLSTDGRVLAYGLADNSIRVRTLSGDIRNVTLAEPENTNKAEPNHERPQVMFSFLRSPVKLSSDGANYYVNAIREFKKVNRWEALNGTPVSSLAVARRDLSPFPIPIPMGAVPEFSKDGKHLTTASLTNGVKLWDLRTGTAEQIDDSPVFSMHLPVSSDGKLVVKIQMSQPQQGKPPKMAVTVNEVGSGRETFHVSSDFSGFAMPIFSTDSRFLAISDYAGLDVYELKTANKVYSEKQVQSFNFSPNSEYFAYTNNSDLVVLKTSDWRTKTVTSKVQNPLRGFLGQSPIIFDSDSSHFALIDEGKIELWDLSNGSMRSTPLQRGSDGYASQDSSGVVFAPGKHRISFTTDRSLYHWDYDSGKIAQSALATDFWGNLNYSPDGRILALGGAENRVRLFDVERDMEIGSLVAPSQHDWLMITPDGRLDASRIEEIDEVHWIMYDDPVKAQPLELFTRDFYEPRLLPRVLSYEKFPEIPDLTARNRALPEIKIASIANSGDHVVKVKVEVRNTESPIQKDASGHPLMSGAQRLRLFRDGRLVASAPATDDTIKLDSTGQASFEFNVTIPHSAAAKDIDFSAYAFNSELAKSVTAHSSFPLPAESAAAPKGRAYIVVIGVNANQVEALGLKYAANDASAMSTELAKRMAAGQTYDEVIPIKFIADSPKTIDLAKKDNLKAVLDVLAGRTSAVPRTLSLAVPATKQLKKATPDDLVLIFFAGHGFADDSGNFYLLPSDAGKQQAANVDDYKPHAISSIDLSQWLGAIDARDLMLIIDACQSAAAVDSGGFKPGPMGSRGLGQLAYDKGMQILAAAQKSDVAIESSDLDHGLLTYALIQDGLISESADWRPTDHKIMLSEWLQFGVKRVPEIDEELRLGTLKQRGVQKPNPTQPAAQSPALFNFQWNRTDTMLTVVPEHANAPLHSLNVEPPRGLQR